MTEIEQLVLKYLLKSDQYTRKTLPYLRAEYFSGKIQKTIFEQVFEYVEKYNKVPTKEAITIELDNLSNLSDDEFSQCSQLINELDDKESSDEDWLLESTEKWCQERAVYNAIMDSIQILDGNDQGKDKGAIPELLSDALSVSFDPNIGHDLIEDAEGRHDFYTRVEEHIPFDLEHFNTITEGGVTRKSLNIILAGTGVGKSMAMCHFATHNLLDGKNVLYITMEMAEEKIAERIDANMLNVPIKELKNMPKSLYLKKMERVKGKTSGKLFVKEYPTASAGAGHFRHLLNELKLKKGFAPDIIYIDYLNICTSSRIKANAQANSYTLIKSIAEELRGLAVEFNLPIFSATQTTRTGYGSSDVGLEDTSESFGLPATADFMFALISTEELEEMGQLMVKQLKNRHDSPNNLKRFVIGVDRPKMRLFNCEQSAQSDVVDDGPAFDKSSFGSRMKEESGWNKKSGRKDFGGLVV